MSEFTTRTASRLRPAKHRRQPGGLFGERRAHVLSKVGAVARSDFSRNTAYLTLSNVVLGFGGLVFWLLAARSYKTAEVGIAISIVSALTLLTSLTSVGWPQIGIRDGSGRRRGLSIAGRAGACNVVLGVVFVMTVVLEPGHFGIALSDATGSLGGVAVACLVTVVAGAAGSSAEGVLVSRHASRLILVESTLTVVARLVGLGVFRSYGSLGLLIANAAATTVGAIGAWILLLGTQGRRSLEHTEAPTVSWMTDVRTAVAVGAPSVVALAPMTLLPTVVLRSLGAAPAAYFTISLSIAYTVRMIPAVMSQTLLAEVGRGAEPRVLLRRALAAVGVASTGLCAVAVMLARPITELFGPSFSHAASSVVVLLVISGALAGINYLLDSMLLALRCTWRYSIINVSGTAIVFACVSIGAQHSLQAAAGGYIVAEIGYAVLGWLILRSAPGWRRPAAVSARGARAQRPVASLSRVTTGRVLFIDGLRGLAATFVVVSHCWDTWQPSGRANAPRLRDLTVPLGLGRWAVTLFIVLSGLSLGLPVWKSGMAWPGGIRAFLMGRFRRIVPPYWTAVLLSSLLAATVLSRDANTLYDQANNIRPLGVLVHLGLLQDLTWAGPAGSTAFWSIAIEFHIYFAFAALLLLVRRYPHCWAPISIVLALVAAWSSSAVGPVASFLRGSVVGLYALFLLGFGMAQWARATEGARMAPSRWFATLAAVELMGIVGAVLADGHVNPLGPLCDLLVGPVVVAVIGEMLRGRFKHLIRVLSSRALVWLGASSYSLYLVHAVVVESVWRGLIALGLDPGGLASLVLEVVVGVAVSIMVARMFYLLVERRCLNNQTRRSNVTHHRLQTLPAFAVPLEQPRPLAPPPVVAHTSIGPVGSKEGARW